MTSSLGALMTGGTLVVAVFATWFGLEISATAGWPWLWDSAPSLAALVAIAPTILPTVEQILSPQWSTRSAIMGTLIWLIILAGVAQGAAWTLEDSKVPRPDGVPPARERLPEWARRGFGVESHAREE